jgi:hypothetical protein
MGSEPASSAVRVLPLARGAIRRTFLPAPVQTRAVASSDADA